MEKFSFSDAEVLEDVVEGVLAGDASTEDAIEGIDDEMKLHGNKFGGATFGNAIDDLAKAGMSLQHGFVMALVGEHYIAFGILRQMSSLGNLATQFVKSDILLCTDSNVFERESGMTSNLYGTRKHALEDGQIVLKKGGGDEVNLVDHHKDLLIADIRLEMIID